MGVVYAAISISFIRHREFQRLKPLAVALMITCVVMSLLTVYSFLGAFGPGITMAVGCIVSACLALLITGAVGSILLFRTREEPRFRQGLLTLFLFSGVVIPIAQLAPIGGAIGFETACDAWHRRQADAIISASEDYRRDHGKYPDEVSELVPDYLQKIPQATCLAPYRLAFETKELDYQIESCGQTTVVYIMVTMGGFGQRYDFATGEWFQYDFLDEDPCYKLK